MNEAGNHADNCAETVPCTPRRFKKWLAKQSLSPDLRNEGKMIVRDINAIALNRTNPDAEIIIPRIRARVDAFIAKLVTR